jgi:signal transduction histidine kinase
VSRRRRWGVIALALIGLVWSLGGEWVSIRWQVRENHLVDWLGGMAFLVAGLVALDRRPGNRIGALLYAVGIEFYAGNYGNTTVLGFYSVMRFAVYLGPALLVHIVLSFPGGRTTSRLDRATVATLYVVQIAWAFVDLLLWNPRAYGCTCPWTPAITGSAQAYLRFESIDPALTALLVGLVLVSLVLRRRRSSPSQRKDLRPIWVATSVISVAFAIESFVPNDNAYGTFLEQVRVVLQTSVPLIFLYGLLTARMVRAEVGDLVLQLRSPVPTGGLQPLLGRALSDPTVRLFYPAGDGAQWVDAAGEPTPLPSDEGVAVTMLEREGRHHAALVHRADLDADLVAGVATAASLAIDNEALQAAVLAQLEEVRASRARIVAAGDEERRRVERNLHDGAQQRLLTLSLALFAARRQLGSGSDEVGVTLQRASEELRLAIDELRDLARGIHPAILTDEGLAHAVRSLAERATTPVAVLELPEQRLPELIEATAYFVVCEALTNVAKYARAEKTDVRVWLTEDAVHVHIDDDGVGGADPASGSGLRGLADRVAAVRGQLNVDSPAGGGTHITAWIPRQ